jgi:hypothetical protein
MLHFAYGSNMHRAVMRKHAPAAEPLGVARLAGYRFVITADGYASVEPAPAGTYTACCGGSRRATASRSMPGRISRAASIAPKPCRWSPRAGIGRR